MKKALQVSFAFIFVFSIFLIGCEKESIQEQLQQKAFPLPSKSNDSTLTIANEITDSENASKRSSWNFLRSNTITSNGGYNSIAAFSRATLQSYDIKIRIKSNKSGYLTLHGYPPFRLDRYISTNSSWQEMIGTEDNLISSENTLYFHTFTINPNTTYNIEIYYRTNNSVPAGWKQIDRGNGIKLFKKDNRNYFVQEINLASNAYLKLKQGTDVIANLNNPSPLFERRPLSWYWQQHPTNALSVTNCQFFGYNGDPASTANALLSLPLKENDVIISAGSYNGENDKRKLGINFQQKEAWIDTYNNYSNNYRIVANNLISPFVICGFHPTNHGGWRRALPIGRTMMGIRDQDGDGKKETIYIFTGSTSQFNANDFLEDDFNCSHVIKLDGSGSSQMIFKGTRHFESSDNRTIPSVIYAIEG